MITPAAAISDPNLLGLAFPGDSWNRWRAILKAAYGEPLSESELVLFKEVAERDPPRRKVRELWIIGGRRSGKDSIASAVATVAAIQDYRPHLRPGERASILCLATDREQARIVHRYIRANFQLNPMFAPLLARETDDGLELANDAEVVIATNSYKSVRGRTVACAVLDECAFWKDENTSSPDVETYTALIPALVTLPGAMLIGISTPYRKKGLLWDRFRACYARNDDDILVIRARSTLLNPLLPQSVVDAALERDPEAASAEWLAEWRSDLADYIDRAIVEAAVRSGPLELPPLSGAWYMGFTDAAGGSGGDSFASCVAHLERNSEKLIVDAVLETKPPFSPEQTIATHAELFKRYSLHTITGDRWAGQFPVEAFGKHGLKLTPCEKVKSDIYRELLPLLNSGRVELPDHPKLINQLCALERRVARGGRDSIDHPVGSHDDVSNAVAGAVVEAAGKGDPLAIWSKLI